MGLTGTELEDAGKRIFDEMGLDCFHTRKQVLLRELDPQGPHGAGENLEFDYLIPYGEICIIGEITGRTRPSGVKSKYEKFKSQIRCIEKAAVDGSIWSLFGIPPEDLRKFRDVTKIQAFFITTELQMLDTNIQEVPGILLCHKAAWRILSDYAENIGSFALPIFLQFFGIQLNDPNSAVSVPVEASMHKKIASDVGLATLYTFEISPYKVLPMALVYRRDDLPSYSTNKDAYQRPLMSTKIKSIRDKLLSDPDFMFPSAILIVISPDCSYNKIKKELHIPEKYGSISVIDGQHRLFSYARDDLKDSLGDSARIIVTAIQFDNVGQDQVKKYSARSFIQINTTQTTVPSSHLDAIAYPVLDQTHPKALASQVILKANVGKNGNKLRGIFTTSQTSLGVIRVTTLITELARITDTRTIHSLLESQLTTKQTIARGYAELFGSSIDDLQEPERLIAKSVICLERYFSRVASVFNHDYPSWDSGNGWTRRGSSIEYTKVFAGFIRLLQQFIQEGLTWEQVGEELIKIRRNVMQVREITTYSEVLFNHKVSPTIPDDGPSILEDFTFLNCNRSRPTSIQEAQNATSASKKRSAGMA